MKSSNHEENLSCGSKREIETYMWELLYQEMWCDRLNSLAKRKKKAYYSDNYAIPRIHLENEKVWLPIDTVDILANTVEGSVLNLAAQKVAGKVSLANEVTLEELRHDHHKKLELFKLEAIDNHTKKKLEECIKAKKEYIENEWRYSRGQAKLHTEDVMARKGKR